MIKDKSMEDKMQNPLKFFMDLIIFDSIHKYHTEYLETCNIPGLVSWQTSDGSSGIMDFNDHLYPILNGEIKRIMLLMEDLVLIKPYGERKPFIDEINNQIDFLQGRLTKISIDYDLSVISERLDYLTNYIQERFGSSNKMSLSNNSKIRWIKTPNLFFILFKTLMEEKYIEVDGNTDPSKIVEALKQSFRVFKANNPVEYAPKSFDQNFKGTAQVQETILKKAVKDLLIHLK
jgi:hypothetical protein